MHAAHRITTYDRALAPIDRDYRFIWSHCRCCCLLFIEEISRSDKVTVCRKKLLFHISADICTVSFALANGKYNSERQLLTEAIPGHSTDL